jgi:putative acetyltransferase
LKIIIRSEGPDDYPIIDLVNKQAFNRPNEAELIRKLRQTREFVTELSLVAEQDEMVVGHILFYPAYIKSTDARHQVLSLGPMAVLPLYQRRGIGSELIMEGLTRAKSLNYKSVIVLGHVHYYPRFGFKPASRWGITPPFDVPENVFMALELEPGELKDKSGTVVYPEAFKDV